MGGELVVDLGNGVKLVLHLLLVEDVDVDLDVLLAVEGDASALASNRSGVALISNIKLVYNYNIFQNSRVHGSKSSASRSLLASVSLG